NKEVRNTMETATWRRLVRIWVSFYWRYALFVLPTFFFYLSTPYLDRVYLLLAPLVGAASSFLAWIWILKRGIRGLAFTVDSSSTPSSPENLESLTRSKTATSFGPKWSSIVSIWWSYQWRYCVIMVVVALLVGIAALASNLGPERTLLVIALG